MFLLETQYCIGSSPWFSDMWCRKEERRGLILQSVWAFRQENYIWGSASQVIPRELGVVMESASGVRSIFPEGSWWSGCLVPPGTGEDVDQHRGEKRTDRCHLLHPMHPIHPGEWQTLTNFSCFSLPVISVSPDEFTHIELGWGYTRNSGKLMAGKILHHGFSGDAHKGQNSWGRGLFSGVCGRVHGNKWYEPRTFCMIAGIYQPEILTQGSWSCENRTAEAIQGHSCSNFINSVNTKIRLRALKQSFHGEIAHGCMQVARLPLPWDNDGQFSIHLWAVVKT